MKTSPHGENNMRHVLFVCNAYRFLSYC